MYLTGQTALEQGGFIPVALFALKMCSGFVVASPRVVFVRVTQ